MAFYVNYQGDIRDSSKPPSGFTTQVVAGVVHELDSEGTTQGSFTAYDTVAQINVALPINLRFKEPKVKNLGRVKPTTFVKRVDHMVQELVLLANDGSNFKRLLDMDPKEYDHFSFLFTDGAKLYRLSANKWAVSGYTSGGKDVHTAFLELKAAEHLRLAVQALKRVEVLNCTPKQYQRTYTGLTATYPNGHYWPARYAT